MSGSIAAIAIPGAIDILASGPLALALRVPAWPAAISVCVGSVLLTCLSIFASARFMTWLQSRIGPDHFLSRRTSRVMARHGTAGAGLLAPLILGHPLTCAVAVLLGAPPRRLAVFSVIGCVLWSGLVLVGLLTTPA